VNKKGGELSGIFTYEVVKVHGNPERNTWKVTTSLKCIGGVEF